MGANPQSQTVFVRFLLSFSPSRPPGIVIFGFFHSRLSYHQRIVDIVPSTFSGLIPAEPIFIFKYLDESACKSTRGVAERE